MRSEYKAQLQAERVPVYERRSRTAAVISAYSNAELGLKPKINTGSAAFDFPILLDPGQTVKFRVADRRLNSSAGPQGGRPPHPHNASSATLLDRHTRLKLLSSLSTNSFVV